MSIEFGKKGPEKIKGEGASGWDELKYAPFKGESTADDAMVEAEEIAKLLDEIDLSIEGGDSFNDTEDKKEEVSDIKNAERSDEVKKAIENLKNDMSGLF